MKALTKWFTQTDLPSMDSLKSIRRLLVNSAINRRRNTRVKYPHTGPSGRLPAVLIRGHFVEVADVSVGGLGLIDSAEIITEDVGHEIEIKFVWPDLTIDQKTQLVGVRHGRHHLKFIDLNPKSLVRLSLLMRPGYVGTQFRKIQFQNQVSLEISVAEMWLGPTGESIRFLDDPRIFAELTFQRAEIEVHNHSIPTYKNRGKNHQKGQRCHPDLLKDLMVCLSNISNPTANILDLIEKISPYVNLEDEVA